MMQNMSGIHPIEYKVLILPDPVEKKHRVQGTDIDLVLPDETHERQQWAQVKGTLVAAGGAAFENPFTTGERALLKPGARVYFDKYVGSTLIGADGEEYRLCMDKDIGGIVTNEGAVPITALQGRNRAALDARK